MNRLLLGLAALTLPTGAALAEPAFRPELFFAGRTHSEGVMLDGFGRPQGRFEGDTRGFRARDGATEFDQVIRFDDGTARTRHWRLVRRGTEVEATATDVVGPARGRIDGRELRLDYTVITDPSNRLLDVDFEQHLTVQPGGQAVENRSLIRKFGITLREARERFVRVGSRGTP